tara:strand:+ start:220 stop:495 length:276 start_codon:yes stop_codon:yes gene_type:complete
MGYRIDTAYVWLETHEDTQIVLMYFINNIPFTFDEFPELARNNPETIQEANRNNVYNMEQLYRSSSYLICEECHPMMNQLDLENPELLPQD